MIGFDRAMRIACPATVLQASVTASAPATMSTSIGDSMRSAKKFRYWVDAK